MVSLIKIPLGPLFKGGILLTCKGYSLYHVLLSIPHHLTNSQTQYLTNSKKKPGELASAGLPHKNKIRYLFL